MTFSKFEKNRKFSAVIFEVILADRKEADGSKIRNLFGLSFSFLPLFIIKVKTKNHKN